MKYDMQTYFDFEKGHTMKNQKCCIFSMADELDTENNFLVVTQCWIV